MLGGMCHEHTDSEKFFCFFVLLLSHTTRLRSGAFGGGGGGGVVLLNFVGRCDGMRPSLCGYSMRCFFVCCCLGGRRIWGVAGERLEVVAVVAALASHACDVLGPKAVHFVRPAVPTGDLLTLRRIVFVLKWFLFLLSWSGAYGRW